MHLNRKRILLALFFGIFSSACSQELFNKSVGGGIDKALGTKSTVVTNTVTLTDIETDITKLIVVPRSSTVEPKSELMAIPFTSKVVTSENFFVKITAYGRTPEEIQTYLTGSIRKRVSSDLYKITLGDRMVSCLTGYESSTNNTLVWIKGVCLQSVEVGLPANSGITVEIADPYL